MTKLTSLAMCPVLMQKLIRGFSVMLVVLGLTVYITLILSDSHTV